MKITIQEVIYNSLKEKGEIRTLINVVRTKDGAAVTIV